MQEELENRRREMEAVMLSKMEGTLKSRVEHMQNELKISQKSQAQLRHMTREEFKHHTRVWKQNQHLLSKVDFEDATPGLE